MVKMENYIVVQDPDKLPTSFKKILAEITAEAKCKTSTFCVFCDQKDDLILKTNGVVNSILVNSVDESFLTYELECRKKNASLPMHVLIDNIDRIGEKHLQFIDKNTETFNKNNMWLILGQPDEKDRLKNTAEYSRYLKI